LCPKGNFERRRLNGTCGSGSAFRDNYHHGGIGGHIIGAVDLQLLQELENKARMNLRVTEVSNEIHELV
jgi:hypothetical protein